MATIDKSKLKGKALEVYNKIEKQITKDKDKGEKLMENFISKLEEAGHPAVAKKKATPKKATPKKATPKKATPKKAALKKAAPKKAKSTTKRGKSGWQKEAKKIQKDLGVTWKEALRIYKSRKKTLTGGTESTAALIKNFKQQFSIPPHSSRDLQKDAGIKAKTAVKRKSPTYGKKGGAKKPYYYEYRMNRRDNSKVPAYLEQGGEIKFDDSPMMKKLWNERGYDIPYLESLSNSELIGIYQTEFDNERTYNFKTDSYEIANDYAKGGEIIEIEGFGKYKEVDGEIKVGDMAISENGMLNEYVDEDDDLYFINETHTKVIPIEEYAKGGKIGFEALSDKVAKRYEGKKVPSKFQEEYGKTYDKEEAKEVGDKVAAKVYRQQQAKMEKGGEIDYFEQYDKLPTKPRNIVEKYQEKMEEGDYDFKDSADFLKEMEAEGYTFEYGLDNEPYELRKMAKGGKLNDFGIEDESVYDHIDNADLNLRSAGTKLWENKHPKSDEFEDLKMRFDSELDGDILTPREQKELGYAKGGTIIKKGNRVRVVNTQFEGKEGLVVSNDLHNGNYQVQMQDGKIKGFPFENLMLLSRKTYAKGGHLTSYGLSFEKVDYDVNVNPNNLEVDVNIKESDSVNHYDLNDTNANWEQHHWGYMVYPKNEKQLYDVLKALRVSVSKKRLAEFVKDGSYAKGGEIGDKMFSINSQSIGKVKYSIDFFDGYTKNKDGSPQIGIMTARTKKELEDKSNNLARDGYRKVSSVFSTLHNKYAKGGRVTKRKYDPNCFSDIHEYGNSIKSDIETVIKEKKWLYSSKSIAKRHTQRQIQKLWDRYPNDSAKRAEMRRMYQAELDRSLNRYDNEIKEYNDKLKEYDKELLKFEKLWIADAPNKREEQYRRMNYNGKKYRPNVSFEEGGEIDCQCVDCVDVSIDEMVFVEPQDKEKFLSGGVILGTLGGAYVGYKIGKSKK